MQVKPLVKKWIQEQDAALQPELAQWVDQIFYPALNFVYKERKLAHQESVETTVMPTPATRFSVHW